MFASDYANGCTPLFNCQINFSSTNTILQFSQFKQQFKQTNSPFYFLAFSITFHDISCASLHNDFVELAKMQVNIQGVEHDLRRIEQIDSRVYNKMGVPVVWLPFLCSWIINEFENLGKRGSALGKQNVRVTCPTGKVESKYFSSPVNTTSFPRSWSREDVISMIDFILQIDDMKWYQWERAVVYSFCIHWAMCWEQPRTTPDLAVVLNFS